MDELRPYQSELKNKLYAALETHRSVLVQCPTGGGKCLGKDTPVLMADGSILPVQDIKVGDQIMGDDSTPRNVLSVTTGRENLYRITPTKGEPWVCNESHILSLVSTATDCGFIKGQVYDIELRDYLLLSKSQKHILKQYRAAVDSFSNNPEQPPLDPYFLGVLIGDGSLKHGICVTTPDKEIVDEVYKQADLFKLSVRHETMHNNKSSNYHIVAKDWLKNGRKGGANEITNIVKSLGANVICDDKFIPDCYKKGTVQTRLQILAGLLDTDGYLNHNFEFVSKSNTLANDVVFVARSLGFAAYITEKIVNDVMYYRLSISGDVDKIPTRIKRKQAEPRKQIKSVLRTGFTVTAIGEGEYYGFEIDGNRRFLLGDFTVTHNTVIFTSIIQDLVNQGKRGLLLVHRRELIRQAEQKIFKTGINYGHIMSGVDAYYSRPMQLASVQTLVRRNMPKKIDFIIVDECFPKGTLIDGRRIESIAVGDYVNSFNHALNKVEKKKVTRVFSSDAQNLCELQFSNGSTLVCTPGHPLFDVAQNKYVPAIHLNESSEFYYDNNSEALQSMRKNDCTANTTRKIHAQKRQSVLFKGLFKRIFEACKFSNHGADEQEIRIAAHEEKKSNVIRRHSQENVFNTAKNRASSKSTRWQWSRVATCTAYARRSSAIANRVCYHNREDAQSDNECSELLQSGHSGSGSAFNYRSGRSQSFFTTGATEGQKEGCNFGTIRLENAEVYERASVERFAELCADGKVYNIEVEDNHNYFANGILVHNCHHSVSSSYRSILNQYPEAKVIGFTATPCRRDGSGFEDIFQTLITGPSVKFLIENGFLVAPKIYSVPLREDLSKLKTVAGDYRSSDIEAIMDRDVINGDIIESYKKHALNKKCVVFATTVKHSLHIVERYNQAGIPAVHIDGETPTEVRDTALRKFAKGDYLILSNVEIVTEGFDVPAIECVQLVRPTQSLSLYLQMVGRGLRSANGKERCIILDHANNVFTHLAPQHDREWKLTGFKKNKRTKSEEPVLQAGDIIVKAKDETGRLFNLNEIPREITSIELVEIEYTLDNERRDYLLRELAIAKKRKLKPLFAFINLTKKYGKPTVDEIHLMQKAAGYKSGWIRHQLEEHGYAEKRMPPQPPKPPMPPQQYNNVQQGKKPTTIAHTWSF